MILSTFPFYIVKRPNLRKKMYSHQYSTYVMTVECFICTCMFACFTRNRYNISTHGKNSNKLTINFPRLFNTQNSFLAMYYAYGWIRWCDDVVRAVHWWGWFIRFMRIICGSGKRYILKMKCKNNNSNTFHRVYSQSTEKSFSLA